MIKFKVFTIFVCAYFGEDWTLSEEQAKCLEAFVCSLYNLNTASSEIFFASVLIAVSATS